MKMSRRAFGSGLAATAASLATPAGAAGFAATITAPRVRYYPFIPPRRITTAELCQGLRRGEIVLRPEMQAIIDEANAMASAAIEAYRASKNGAASA